LKKIIRFADCVGMGASALCLVHCLGMPLLLVFPLSGLMGKDDSFHRYLAIVVTAPVLLALAPGFIAHRRWLVLVLGGAGLAGVIAGFALVGPRYGESAETVLTVIGGAQLVAAHYVNRRACRPCAQRAA
jgi:hypothetical protein